MKRRFLWVLRSALALSVMFAALCPPSLALAAPEGQLPLEERNSFHLTRVAAEALQEYARSRDKYPKFTDFVPELLRRMAAEQPPTSLTERIMRSERGLITWVWSIVGLQWVVAAVLSLLILRRMMQIRRQSRDGKID